MPCCKGKGRVVHLAGSRFPCFQILDEGAYNETTISLRSCPLLRARSSISNEAICPAVLAVEGFRRIRGGADAIAGDAVRRKALPPERLHGLKIERLRQDRFVPFPNLHRFSARRADFFTMQADGSRSRSRSPLRRQFIPARAGNTFHWVSHRAIVVSSSPRERGTQPPQKPLWYAARFIPARAGVTLTAS